MSRAVQRSALVVFLLACGCAAAPDSGPPRSAAALLAEMKAACGGSAWDRVRGWHETAVATGAGRPPISAETWHDMLTLKTAMINRVDGRVVRHFGFDGVSYWQTGADGRVEIGRDPALLRRHRRDAYLSSFAWFYPERFPAGMALAGTRTWEGARLDVLRIAPDGADSFELWVDRESRRVRRIVAESEYADLSDYRFFDGVCSATTGRQGDGDPAHEIVLNVQSVETTALVPASVFEPPRGGADR